MVRYVAVSEDQLPQGRSALLLFVEAGNLCAGVLQRRCDGRLVRDISPHSQPGELIAVVSRLMAGQSLDDDFYVIIEGDAYWPDAFPEIRKFK